jgi:hypothetical protein
MSTTLPGNRAGRDESGVFRDYLALLTSWCSLCRTVSGRCCYGRNWTAPVCACRAGGRRSGLATVSPATGRAAANASAERPPRAPPGYRPSVTRSLRPLPTPRATPCPLSATAWRAVGANRKPSWPLRTVCWSSSTICCATTALTTIWAPTTSLSWIASTSNATMSVAWNNSATLSP